MMDSVLKTIQPRCEAFGTLPIRRNTFCNELDLSQQSFRDDVEMLACLGSTILNPPLHVIIHEPILLENEIARSRIRSMVARSVARLRAEATNTCTRSAGVSISML